MTAPASSRENRWATTGGSGASATGGGTGSKDGDPDASGKAKKQKNKKKGGLLKSKKFKMILIGLVVLGAAGYMFLMPKKAAPPVGGDVVPIEATTLNLAGGHYLKIAVAIELVKGKATATSFFTSHAAELTIDEFSNRTVDSLSTNAARQKLTADLKTKVQGAYPGEVFDVFVTQFVMQ